LQLEGSRLSASIRAQLRGATHRRSRASGVCGSHRWARTVSDEVLCAKVAIRLSIRPSGTPQCSNLDDQR
jgi:hypothetical protein